MEKELEKGYILRNSIITPDNTELVSRNVWDFRLYVDKNGETYMNDGGSEYLRRSVNKEPFIDNTIYSTDSFEKIRSICDWGTYGKDGNSELQYKKINTLSNAHIEAIIEDFGEDVYKGILKQELEYRLEHNIFIED